MEEAGVFNRLVSELTLNERTKLLSRLNAQLEYTKEPLYEEESGKEFADLDNSGQYENLPWYYKLWYFILGILKNKKPDKVYEDSKAASLGSLIDREFPGFFHHKRECLLPDFYREIAALKENSRFFYSALDSSVGRDRGAFFAFLGSLEMETVHRRMTAETDPEVIAKLNPDLREAEIHQYALRAMESIVSTISEEERNAMYFNARCLHCLKELSSFLYDRILMAFANDAVLGQSCAVRLVREQLSELNNILYSLQQVPSVALLESLFIFILQEQSLGAEIDIDSETGTLLSRAEISLSGIRHFNKSVPLTLILRYAGRNMALGPKQISGGEDWFAVYSDFWKKEIDKQCHAFSKARKEKRLSESFNFFLKGNTIKPLANVLSDSNPQGIPVAGSIGLAFLSAFYTTVFLGEVNSVLRPVLLDGEFYKRENRTKFTEAYNDLMKTESFVEKFDAKLSPEGEYGQRYAQARNEMSSLPVKRRKIQMVVQEASEESMRMVDTNREALKVMVQILNGILKKDATGAFDTLSNISAFSAKNAPPFTVSVEEAAGKLERALKLLDEVNLLDTGK